MPLEMPVSTPPSGVIVPTIAGLADQAPPVGDDVSGSVSPTHIALRPRILPGDGLISSVAVA